MWTVNIYTVILFWYFILLENWVWIIPITPVVYNTKTLNKAFLKDGQKLFLKSITVICFYKQAFDWIYADELI